MIWAAAHRAKVSSRSSLTTLYIHIQSVKQGSRLRVQLLGLRKNTRLPIIPSCTVFCFFASIRIAELSNMKKMELKLVIEDEKSKRRAMKAIAGVEGVESVSVDMKERKMTVIGEADPVSLTVKLRKFGFTELLSVGPAKEEKKEEKKEGKKPDPPAVVYLNQSSYPPYPYTVVTEDYNPHTCTIC